MKPKIEHLYVHVPFCTHICPYCAFVKTRNSLPEINLFLEVLRSELRRAAEKYDLVLQTVFFGGGTPSALSVSQLEELFSWWPWRDGSIEFTFEANPATVSRKKADCLLKGGVNRLSFGVQSFDSTMLKLLGRTHDRAQVEASVRLAREAGFRNINLDLMFALPGQTLELWRETLREAVGLGPDHLSCYNLNYEEDTEFLTRLNGGEFRIDEGVEQAFFLEAQTILGGAGFQQDEISNFARAGFSCRHNWAYWDGKDYLGLGPGAWSTVGEQRWQNALTVDSYAQRVEATGSGAMACETVSEETRRREKVMLGLRTREGVALSELASFGKTLDDLEEEGLMIRSGERLSLTSKGAMVADSIAEIFL